MYLLYILQFCCFSINWKWITVGLGHVFTSKPNKHRHMIKSGVWSVPNFVVSVVLGKRMSEKVIRHPLIKFRIWKLLPALTGTLLQQLESWNQNVFVETQSANRCEPKTRAVESSGVRAIIITATVQHSERILHRQPGGRCACVYFFFFVQLRWGWIWFQVLCQDSYTHLCCSDLVWKTAHLFSVFILHMAIWNQKWKDNFPTGINEVSHYHFPPDIWITAHFRAFEKVRIIF